MSPPGHTGRHLALPDLALPDLDLDTDLDGAVVAVEWGEGVAERLSARHLLVRLDRRPDDVRVAVVHRIKVGHGEIGQGEVPTDEPGRAHPHGGSSAGGSSGG